MKKISVVLADDHSLMRKGLRKILELEDDIEVIGEAANGTQAVKAVRELQPQVLILDINMPDMNGVEVVRQLKKESNKTNIMILTIYDDREYLLELIKLGVLGYLLKDVEPQTLIDAVRCISRGEAYIQPTLSGALISEYNRINQPISGKKNLTPREREVLAEIAEGRSNQEISDKLSISEKTVKNHVSNILKKLHLHDRTQAAVYAVKNNLI